MSVFDLIKNDPKYSPTNSTKWFRDKVAALTKGSYSVTNLMKSRNLVDKIAPGHMYAFVYDPKGKDTLPFYDKYPLVLPFRKYGVYMWGLNMHYLHPAIRIRLYDKLVDIVEDERKMVFTWQLVKSNRVPGVNNAVKQYLLTHVKSRFLRLEPDEWKTALFLPFEGFVGASKSDVWRR